VHLRRARTRELPGNIPFSVKKHYIDRFLATWMAPTVALFNKALAIYGEEVDTVVRKHFEAYEHGGLLDLILYVIFVSRCRLFLLMTLVKGGRCAAYPGVRSGSPGRPSTGGQARDRSHIHPEYSLPGHVQVKVSCALQTCAHYPRANDFLGTPTPCVSHSFAFSNSQGNPGRTSDRRSSCINQLSCQRCLERASALQRGIRKRHSLRFTQAFARGYHGPRY